MNGYRGLSVPNDSLNIEDGIHAELPDLLKLLVVWGAFGSDEDNGSKAPRSKIFNCAVPDLPRRQAYPIVNGPFRYRCCLSVWRIHAAEEVISRATSNVLFIIVINPSRLVFRFRLVVGLSMQIIEVIVAPVSFV